MCLKVSVGKHFSRKFFLVLQALCETLKFSNLSKRKRVCGKPNLYSSRIKLVITCVHNFESFYFVHTGNKFFNFFSIF